MAPLLPVPPETSARSAGCSEQNLHRFAVRPKGGWPPVMARAGIARPSPGRSGRWGQAAAITARPKRRFDPERRLVVRRSENCGARGAAEACPAPPTETLPDTPEQFRARGRAGARAPERIVPLSVAMVFDPFG
jgi:hypothetical protein